MPCNDSPFLYVIVKVNQLRYKAHHACHLVKSYIVGQHSNIFVVCNDFKGNSLKKVSIVTHQI